MKIPNPNKWYGWKADTPDRRDMLYTPNMGKRKIPDFIDPLTEAMKWFYNQGRQGSCIANAVNRAVLHRRVVQQAPDAFEDVSRAFTYWNLRLLQGTQAADSGGQIRNGLKAVIKYGCVPNAMMPYSDKDYLTAPTKLTYAAGKLDQVISYHKIPSFDIRLVKDALANGFPVVFGMLVFKQFESQECAKTGVVKLPASIMEGPVGGHAVLAVGYNDNRGVVICDNSWGADWGDKGRFYLPYEAFTELQTICTDQWIIKKVE